MYYYKFNIQDYLSHTMHLSEMEDLAYRRLLDWYYLHERPIPKDIDLIAKHIRMRTHTDCIADVLQEFFIETDNGFESNRANSEIITYNEKSEKASKSAKARWGKNKNKNKGLKSDANALRTECEGNAIHQTLNTKHQTLNTKKESKTPRTQFKAPSQVEVENYFLSKGLSFEDAKTESIKFYSYYDSKGWLVGKSKMKNWKSAVTGWIARSSDKPKQELNFNTTGWSE